MIAKFAAVPFKSKFIFQGNRWSFSLPKPGINLSFSFRMRESKKEKQARVLKIIAQLRKIYPDPKCALDFSNPFELLVATVLSAQCTDKRVNLVTPAVFKRCQTVKAYTELASKDLEKLIRSTGFYKNKTKSILGAAQKVMTEFGGEVPRTMEELVTIPGVGRKTANVILGNAFGIPGMPVDTHMIRLNNLLKLTAQKDPVKIESELTKIVPENEWTEYSHLIILHGRARCIARRPDCEHCEIRDLCPSKKR